MNTRNFWQNWWWLALSLVLGARVAFGDIGSSLPSTAYTRGLLSSTNQTDFWGKAGIKNTNQTVIAVQGINPSQFSTNGGTLQMAASPVFDGSGLTNVLRMVNVRDYGATGNGVSDDTAAISNAWTFWTTNGGTLYFPAGVYRDSGTHFATNLTTLTDIYIDGRTIKGDGNSVWNYTGTQQLLVITNDCPSIEGLEFRCNTAATNCIYIDTPQNSPALRNLRFWGWTNAMALLVAEADKTTLDHLYFEKCDTAVGLGYRCNSLRGDLEPAWCRVGVAIGVPTPNFPQTYLRASQNVHINMLSLYTDTPVAIDAGANTATAEINGHFWYPTNGITVGKIDGISTNLSPSILLLRKCYWEYAGTNAPVSIFGANNTLVLEDCWINSHDAVTMAVKSYLSSDGTRIRAKDIRWTTSAGGPYLYEDSLGRHLLETSTAQDKWINQQVGVYAWNSFSTGGGGYLLDALDASFSGPVARFGMPNGANPNVSGLWAGMDVRYASSRPSQTLAGATTADGGLVTVTNADLSIQKGLIKLNNVLIASGAGAPVATAPNGSLYLRTDGTSTTTIYIMVSGSWVAK